jgi:hypothetical protein
MVGTLLSHQTNAGRADLSSRGELRPTAVPSKGFFMPRLAILRPVLIAIVAAAGLSALAGCAPSTSTSGAGSSAAQGAAGLAGSGTCSEFSAKSFAGIVNVPIGKGYVAGQDSAGGVICWFGIGKNAGVSGSKVETLTDDNILISTIGVDGLTQFTHFTGKSVNLNPIVPLSGVGDKAAYEVSELTGNVPQLYAVKAQLYCGIQMNATTSELVNSSMAVTAKSEGALCNDAFSHH